ncbi:MAG: hypothetical protein M3319_08375, partial [Actinomycetota bacterium]|nr:hypothetical protein [Actinomycetota bacterium]
ASDARKYALMYTSFLLLESSPNNQQYFSRVAAKVCPGLYDPGPLVDLYTRTKVRLATLSHNAAEIAINRRLPRQLTSTGT